MESDPSADAGGRTDGQGRALCPFFSCPYGGPESDRLRGCGAEPQHVLFPRPCETPPESGSQSCCEDDPLVILAPPPDDGPGLGHAVKPLQIQAFIPELSLKPEL